MTRADICASDDAEAIARLQEVLAELGWVADDTWHDSPLGVGLTRFRRGADELTVFIDTWLADVAGPAAAVREVLEALSAG
ncbi:MAG: hypothetical protein U0871_21245 [Gemmataceae bacterium]